jgi:hypothetical protein
MLLQIDASTREITRVHSERLSKYKFHERDLQDTLFQSFDRLFGDARLLPISQSKQGKEEPDIMAIDEQGDLYILEIKIWESQSENLLQALRYGQIFGAANYEELNQRFQMHNKSGQSLLEAHAALFDISLAPEEFNCKQVFVVLINGLDLRTRQAIQYWRSCGLDVRPWIYRVYPSDNENIFYIEMNRFVPDDNPYDDVSTGYYILNTNDRRFPDDHNDMIKNGKAAAYFTPWKYKIERLQKGDVVFLYQSRIGIVAVGRASGKLEKRPYQGNPEDDEEEYSMLLDNFQRLSLPLPAAKIKEITGINYRFLSTMFSIDANSGEVLQKYIQAQHI